MIPALVSIVLGGGVILGTVVGWRWLDARVWRRSLVALKLTFLRGLKPDDVAGWLAHLGSLRVPMALEVVATHGSLSHHLLVPKNRQAEVLAATRSSMPGVRVEEAPDYLVSPPAGHGWIATELKLTHLSHQLGIDRAEGTAAALLAALGQLQAGERAVVQWCFTGLHTPKRRPATEGTKELAQAEKVKHAHPLLQTVGRVGVSAPMNGRAGALLSRIAGTMRLLDAPSARVVRRSLTYGMVAGRIARRALPVAAWPLTVNVREAAGLVGVPIGSAASMPGLTLSRSRQLPPGPVPGTGGTTVAMSNYPGHSGQTLALTADDRLRHMYLVGPTGVGKSNLLASMAIQDATNGRGLALIDPKGDLVEAILARLPESATERVIVMDPAATDRPVGFNPLYVPQADEHARELAADRVLHIFKDLFRANWGPRSDDLLRAVLLSLVSVPAPNGQAFTICEAPELLTRPALRNYVIHQAGLPEMLKRYWASFDAMSEAERNQHAGPVLNKLRAFTMRTATRLMLGQSSGIDLTQVMRERRILLVSLAKGRIGEETSSLIGSLLMAALWQAALGRASIKPEARRPFFLYLDEFQDVVRLSGSLPDVLAQARGLGVGAVLANQYLAQLPDAVQKAVLGTVRSQVAFQVEYDDAKLLERRFAPSLTADDLMGLSRFEIALRACVNGETVMPVTGMTLPLGEPTREAAELAQAARAASGQERAEVERGLAARATPVKRSRRDGGRLPERPEA